MNTALQIISMIGGLGGFSAIIWLIVDWARKDERQLQLTARVDRLEKQVDHVESTLIAHVKDISIEVAKIGQRLDNFETPPQGHKRRQ